MTNSRGPVLMMPRPGGWETLL